MDKKEILSNASLRVKAGGRANFFVRGFRRLRRHLATALVFAKRWAKRQDRLVWFNIALLALVCLMLFVMFGNVKKAKNAETAYTDIERAEVYDTLNRVRMPRRPTVVISRNKIPMVSKPITLPLRRARALPARRTKVDGTVMVRGAGAKLAPMTTVNGDLILQNMRVYTLPCGTRVNGDLLLRNVRLLKFCGAFSVSGNIYVSKTSAFGPLPKDATLGGQVIF